METLSYWGEPTSTIDWCEQNYQYSYYIAEFWNSLSNLAIFLVGLVGVYYTYNKSNNYPKRYILSYFGLSFVGLGSFLFHSTLTWQGQLLDEIPMVIGTQPLAFSFYCLSQKSEKNKNSLAKLQILMLLIVIPLYVIYKRYVLFLSAFSVSLLYAICKGFYEATKLKNNAPKNQINEFSKPFQIQLRAIYILFTGLILWVSDQLFCDQLNDLKNEVGPILQPLLEFHAWWHFLAGFGVYHLILASQLLSHLQQYQYDEQVKLYQHEQQQQNQIFQGTYHSLVFKWFIVFKPGNYLGNLKIQ